jgi:MOSC domain-containing protein YiiM
MTVGAGKWHSFSKSLQSEITILAGLGVEGDAHMGETVKHRSRVAVDPSQPNLRQVHLMHAELFDELRSKGFNVGPGNLGENIVTQGLDLLSLPRGALLRLGAEATVEVTGLRNPCKQIDDFMPGLLKAVLDRDDQGNLIRKTGIMTVVRSGGKIRPGDAIVIDLPDGPWHKLDRV